MTDEKNLTANAPLETEEIPAAASSEHAAASAPANTNASDPAPHYGTVNHTYHPRSYHVPHMPPHLCNTHGSNAAHTFALVGMIASVLIFAFGLGMFMFYTPGEAIMYNYTYGSDYVAAASAAEVLKFGFAFSLMGFGVVSFAYFGMKVMHALTHDLRAHSQKPSR